MFKTLKINKFKHSFQISPGRSGNFKFLIIFLVVFLLLTFVQHPLDAQSHLNSPNYNITFPSINSGAGVGVSGASSFMGVTLGQNAPGQFSSTGYRVKSGFQYIYPFYPFSFTVTPIRLNFGSLATDSLSNEQTLTLKVTNGSSGGYQVTSRVTRLMTSDEGKTIANSACDTACDQNTASNWLLTSTYGLGYNMTGTDVPSDFSGNKFRRFAVMPETAVRVMGKTTAEGGTPGRDKTSTMTVRVNINSTQPAGSYRNTIILTAIPIY